MGPTQLVSKRLLVGPKPSAFELQLVVLEQSHEDLECPPSLFMAQLLQLRVVEFEVL